MPSGFNVCHRKAFPTAYSFISNKNFIAEKSLQSQVCRLLLEAAVLTGGGGLAHLLIIHFHLCISPSGWLGVTVALSFFGPLSELCVLPLLSVFLLFSIPNWFLTGQW